MKIDEAKTILQSYRPSGADAHDSAFAEALQLARENPELGNWFSRQQAFDAALSSEMSHVAAPADLRNRILQAAADQSGSAERSPEGRTAGSTTTTTRRSWWREAHGWKWASAAAVVVLLGSGAFLLRPRSTPLTKSPLAAIAIEDAEDGSKHGNRSKEASELRKKMNQPTTRLQDLLPIDYETLHESGCRTVKVEGRDVVEFCFKRNGAGHHWYIARREDFPKLKAPEVPEVSQEKGASIATWADKTHLHVLVTTPDPKAFDQML
jgi:hypothetical protein